MNPPSIAIAGIGAVTPAGWGVAALRRAVAAGEALPCDGLGHSSGDDRFRRRVRRVPQPDPAPAFLAHGRLRRSGALTRFAAGAALEAVGGAIPPAGGASLGLIVSLLNGCVNFSGKFYGEVVNDPQTASPIVFPETVFNAPASHLAVLLGIAGPVTTLVGNPAHWFAALELGAAWLLDGTVDRCLVVGAEEADWLTAEAMHLLDRGSVLCEGAAAVLLERDGPGPVVESIGPLADPVDGDVVVDDSRGGRAGSPAVRAGFRCLPRTVLGTAPGASAAIATVLAADFVRSGDATRAVSAAEDGEGDGAVGASIVRPHS